MPFDLDPKIVAAAAAAIMQFDNKNWLNPTNVCCRMDRGRDSYSGRDSYRKYKILH